MEIPNQARLYHHDGQLFIPDLAICPSSDVIVICVVQVCEERPRTLSESWTANRIKFDHPKFREAAARKRPNKELICCPLLLDAQGIWPRCNKSTEGALQIPPPGGTRHV